MITNVDGYTLTDCPKIGGHFKVTKWIIFVVNKMSRSSIVANHMARLRMSELDQVRGYFTPRMRVLEIGGGNGFQSSKISAWGCDVSSIDLKGRSNRSLHFDVQDYDGKNFPFEDEMFDVVFSSNVLEHVVDIERLLGESERVIKPDGLMIHIMPSPSWRFWTIVSHYPYLIGSVLKRLLSRNPKEKTGIYPDTIPIIPPPHGEFQSAFHELHYYSRWYWKKVFETHGLEIVDCHSNGIYCSGYALFPNMGIPMRKVLANILGSSGNIFILHRLEEPNEHKTCRQHVAPSPRSLVDDMVSK